MQTKLDKAFKIIVDISNRKVTIPQAISWYVTDENIAHLNCQIIDEVEDSIIDIQSYKLSMRVLTPSRILKEVNPDYFLLENVKMKKETNLLRLFFAGIVIIAVFAPALAAATA